MSSSDVLDREPSQKRGRRLLERAARFPRLLAFWLQALSREEMDLSLRTHRGLTTRIVEDPARTLGPAELEHLLDELREIAARTLPGGSLTYGIFSGDRERLSHTIITIVTDETSARPIAFNALAKMDLVLDGAATSVTHLGLVMVDPDYRGRGLSGVLYGLTVLVLFVRDGLRPRWISNVTQVPAVLGMVGETFSNAFPSPAAGARASFSHLQLARGIMASHRHVFGVGPQAGFDEAHFVITDSYAGGGSDDLKKTFAEAPKHRSAAYNELCDRTLDYARGDDFLQLAQMDMAAARRYLLNSLPRGSLPSLLGAGVLLMLQRLILPLLHWLDDKRSFGVLRPRDAERRDPS